METEKIIRLSVRNLVEFILKEGDIDNIIFSTTLASSAKAADAKLTATAAAANALIACLIINYHPFLPSVRHICNFSLCSLRIWVIPKFLCNNFIIFY